MSSRKRAKTSYLWSHFTIQNPGEKIASCDYCGELLRYKATVSNLKKHIQRRHRMIILPTFDNQYNSGFVQNQEVCMTSSNDNQAAEFQPAKHFASTAAQGFPSVAAVKAGVVENSLQPLKTNRSQKLDKLLLQLFIYDYQPFSIVEDEGFVNFVRGLNPSYKLPEKKIIINCLLPDEYDKCFTAVREELQAVHSVCLSTDTWTSESHETFLGVSAHYITETFELRSIFLDCSVLPEFPTSASLAETLRGTINKFNLVYKVLAVVSEDDANINCAVTRELGKEHIVCFAHTLNFILQEALKIPRELLDKMRVIISYLKASQPALEKLDSAQKVTQEQQEPLKLILDDSTRWNSTFYMIQRFSELEDAIKSTITWLNKKLPILSEEEWTALKELTTVLEPFEDVTKEISDERYVTGSLIIPLTNGLRSVCEKMREQGFGLISRCVIDVLLKGVNTRMVKIEDNNTLALATFLDPRFKLAPFTTEFSAQYIKDHCTSLMAGVWVHQQNAGSTDAASDDFNNKDGSTSKAQSSKFSVWESLDSKIASRKSSASGSMSAAIIEINRYLEDAFLGRKEDPLVWWQKNEHYYPLMGRVVKTKFNILGTSLPCERLFTKEGALVIKRRSRLQTKNIEKILFLNANSFLIY